MTNVIDLSTLNLAEDLVGDITSIIYGQVITESEKILREHVMNTVYSGKSPAQYTRTNGVLNAVEISEISVSGTKATFKIWINPNLMSTISAVPNAPFPTPDGGPSWGSHEGFSGQDFREGLIETLDEGGGSPYYSHPAHNFYQKTHDEADVELIKILGNGLSAAGWDVSF